jgi:hypothetical protein
MAARSPFLSVLYAQCCLALVGRSNARDLLRAEGDRADRVLIVVAVLIVFARFLIGHCAASARGHQDVLLDCTGFTRVQSLSPQIRPERYIAKHPTAAYEFVYRNRYAARRPALTQSIAALSSAHVPSNTATSPDPTTWTTISRAVEGASGRAITSPGLGLDSWRAP